MQRTDYPAIGETLYTETLENGLPVFVVPKSGYRRKFAVLAADYGGADRVFTADGARHDTPAGVAHYLEHKMFDTPEGDALMRMSALGADPNAFTSQAMTAYHFECTEHFEENLRTLLSFVSVPYFTQESVDKERGIIAQEIRMYEDDPDFAVYFALMRCLYGTGPLCDTVGGTVESIQEITPELLYACHAAFYRPSNLALAVVGDADPDEVAALAREILPASGGARPAREYPESGLAPVSRRAEARMTVSAPQFSVGIKLAMPERGPALQRQRICAGLALRCLFGRSSPFYLRHYAEGLLNATFGFSLDHAASQTLAAFDGETPKDPEAVLDAICAELDRARREGIDPALFDRQKKAQLGARIRGLASFEGAAVGLIGGCFSGFNALDSVECMKSVALDEAQAWIRDALDPERLAMSVILPKEE